MNIPFRSSPLARVVQVIHVQACDTADDGTPRTPGCFVNMYFSLDGDLLACHNEANGPPDAPQNVGEGLWDADAKEAV